jgi:hypothetical protein
VYRNEVRVRELIGWELDPYEYRPTDLDSSRLAQSLNLSQQCPAFQHHEVFLATETTQLKNPLSAYMDRPDLLEEMAGLTWSLGIVNLRGLIAFQRRLAFDPAVQQYPIPAAQDWAALLSLSFGAAKPIVCSARLDHSANTMIFQSENPNLHFRMTDNAALPVNLHAGGPFLEVASLRGRWFLRDGYHRAYSLLKAGIFAVPAVIVEATTIEELGATKPWFFSEQVLFSARPPYVQDFLNDELVLEYDRPQLFKTLRITLEETLTPAPPPGELT